MTVITRMNLRLARLSNPAWVCLYVAFLVIGYGIGVLFRP